MNAWTVLALLPLLLYLGGAVFALRREDAATRRAWWRPVLHDPFAVTAGVLVGGACVAVVVTSGELLGLPSALLMAVTAAAIVGRFRARPAAGAE